MKWNEIKSAALPRQIKSISKEPTKLDVNQEGIRTSLPGGRTISIWPYRKSNRRERNGKTGFLVRLKGPTGMQFVAISQESLEAINFLVSQIESGIKISYRVYVRSLKDATVE